MPKIEMTSALMADTMECTFTHLGGQEYEYEIHSTPKFIVNVTCDEDKIAQIIEIYGTLINLTKLEVYNYDTYKDGKIDLHINSGKAIQLHTGNGDKVQLVAKRINDLFARALKSYVLRKPITDYIPPSTTKKHDE